MISGHTCGVHNMKGSDCANPLTLYTNASLNNWYNDDYYSKSITLKVLNWIEIEMNENSGLMDIIFNLNLMEWLI